MIQNRKPRRSPEEEHGSDGVHHDVRYPQLYLPTTRQRPNPVPPFTLADSDEIAGTNSLAHAALLKEMAVTIELSWLLVLRESLVDPAQCKTVNAIYNLHRGVYAGSKTATVSKPVQFKKLV